MRLNFFYKIFGMFK